jgi:hypothetical protein
VPLLKIHWDALSADRVENSVWSTTPREGHQLAEDDLKELETLFAAKPSKSTPVGAGWHAACDLCYWTLSLLLGGQDAVVGSIGLTRLDV